MSYICQDDIKQAIMTQITINIEDKSIVPHLKKILSAIEGVSIAKSEKKRKCSLDQALEDIHCGRVHNADNVDQLFNDILGK
jgi:hypothetical protein